MDGWFLLLNPNLPIAEANGVSGWPTLSSGPIYTHPRTLQTGGSRKAHTSAAEPVKGSHGQKAYRRLHAVLGDVALPSARWSDAPLLGADAVVQRLDARCRHHGPHQDGPLSFVLPFVKKIVTNLKRTPNK